LINADVKTGKGVPVEKAAAARDTALIHFLIQGYLPLIFHAQI
jgi:hypothetical protein